MRVRLRLTIAFALRVAGVADCRRDGKMVRHALTDQVLLETLAGRREVST